MLIIIQLLDPFEFLRQKVLHIPVQKKNECKKYVLLCMKVLALLKMCSSNSVNLVYV